VNTDPVRAKTEQALRRLRRYLLAENWTWDEPDLAARRRANWPAWRRAVRPVGAAAYWIGAIVGIVFDPHGILSAGGLYLVLIPIVVVCAVFGIADGFRQRRADRSASTSPSPNPR
jgi:hypothetical protein